MRSAGVRGLLIYCADFHCSHSIAISADQWPDHVLLSDIEPRFVCKALRQAWRRRPAGLPLERSARPGDGLSLMPWSTRFAPPIRLPDGRNLTTLKDAIAWLAKEVPKSEHGMKQVQAAAHCVTEAAENGGPLLFARMGMMQAINREKFDSKRKSQHWGKRKLARDQ
jgi:hypothetical protein